MSKLAMDIDIFRTDDVVRFFRKMILVVDLLVRVLGKVMFVL